MKNHMGFIGCFTPAARVVSVAVFQAHPRTSGFLSALDQGWGHILCTLVFHERVVTIEASWITLYRPDVFANTYVFEERCGLWPVEGFYRFAIGNEMYDMGEIRLRR